MSPSLDDYRWLVSEAAAWLERATEEPSAATTVQLTTRLRKELSAERAALVIEQIDLRRRAHIKFADAARMFFTRRGLEQATDERIAAAKAERFPSGPVADLCCGVGGDLGALARRGLATGVDRDPIVAILAEANLQAWGAANGSVACVDVEQFPLDQFAAWHIDPDRRPRGQRTTDPEYYAPPLAVLEVLLAQLPHAAIKLAPAAEAPAAWCDCGERMWIGHRRECQQQVVWLGDLARHPGQHAALVLDGDDQSQEPSEPLVGPPGVAIVPAEQIGRYLFEPHAAVLAADLAGTLAARDNLSAVVSGVAYLTGNEPLDSPLLATFKVLEVLPLDLKRVKAAVQALNLGPMEIKQRGAGLSPERVLAQLAPRGDRPGVVLLARGGKSSIAILAERVK